MTDESATPAGLGSFAFGNREASPFFLHHLLSPPVTDFMTAQVHDEKGELITDETGAPFDDA